MSFKRGDYVFVLKDGSVIGSGQVVDGCLPKIPYLIRMAGTVHYVQKWDSDLEMHPQQDYRAHLSPDTENGK
ncbi:hypothetical protein [Streptomyces sp. NPDC014622]|uniref:hypothetical protein n=1 Tax=Streptomyces sp. NPDC014622 TaxID=3364874 RepID=UPI0036F8F93B